MSTSPNPIGSAGIPADDRQRGRALDGATNDDIAELWGVEFDPTDPARFRKAIGRFASGVVVVAAIGPSGDPVGMTCQSFCSLSLDPPLVMFCPSAASTSFPRIRLARTLCISVLARDQDGVSAQFARSGTDKWRGVAWTPGRNGAPRIDGAVLWCEGDMQAEHTGGDHQIVVVQPTLLATAADQRMPLIFHDGRYAGLQYHSEHR